MTMELEYYNRETGAFRTKKFSDNSEAISFLQTISEADIAEVKIDGVKYSSMKSKIIRHLKDIDNITESELINGLFRDAIFKPTAEEIEKYSLAFYNWNESRINGRVFHWTYIYKFPADDFRNYKVCEDRKEANCIWATEYTEEERIEIAI